MRGPESTENQAVVEQVLRSKLDAVWWLFCDARLASPIGPVEFPFLALHPHLGAAILIYEPPGLPDPIEALRAHFEETGFQFGMGGRIAVRLIDLSEVESEDDVLPAIEASFGRGDMTVVHDQAWVEAFASHLVLERDTESRVAQPAAFASAAFHDDDYPPAPIEMTPLSSAIPFGHRVEPSPPIAARPADPWPDAASSERDAYRVARADYGMGPATARRSGWGAAGWSLLLLLTAMAAFLGGLYAAGSLTIARVEGWYDIARAKVEALRAEFGPHSEALPTEAPTLAAPATVTLPAAPPPVAVPMSPDPLPTVVAPAPASEPPLTPSEATLRPPPPPPTYSPPPQPTPPAAETPAVVDVPSALPPYRAPDEALAVPAPVPAVTQLTPPEAATPAPAKRKPAHRREPPPETPSPPAAVGGGPPIDAADLPPIEHGPTSPPAGSGQN